MQEEVLITQIVVLPGRRALTVKRITSLAASIQENGLLQPIIVTESHILVAGLHRLEACKTLGWLSIRVNMVPDDKLKNRLAEIDENLEREKLTAFEESVYMAERKEIYEALYPQSRRGGDRKSEAVRSGAKNQSADSATRSFVEDTAAKTGKAPRTIATTIQIGRAFTEEQVEQIRGTPLEDQKTRLLEIARLPQEDRPAAIAQATQPTQPRTRRSLTPSKPEPQEGVTCSQPIPQVTEQSQEPPSLVQEFQQDFELSSFPRDSRHTQRNGELIDPPTPRTTTPRLPVEVTRG